MRSGSYFVRLLLPEGVGPEAREALSRILVEVASRFSFQGLEDWSVDLPSSVKVLGVEREFHDLTGKGAMNREMRVYFAKKPHGLSFARLVRASFEDLQVDLPRKLARKDWMKEWRKFYRTQILEQDGRKIALVPAWKTAPKGILSVKVHPGQAFGTGTHPTTRLCLLAFLRMQAELGPTAKILDFGAGTGVLALAALALGKSENKRFSAVAVESDPEALRQCGKNARINRRKLRLLRKLPPGKFDFLFANVLAPVLLQERNALARRLKKGGLLVVSGILAKEKTEFLREFSQGLVLVDDTIEGDWAAFLFRRS